MSETDVARARADVALARERLLGSAHALQSRLKPAALASDAWESARDAGETAATRTARAIGQRPVAASAAAIGVAALIARKPLARLFARLRGKISDGDRDE
ncbi:DUF3618 domain-containing protein [Sphingomonas crusticola]|uniref:DUF3618 domain-containing protein n=1 Tax=Sphingomonas crusticola TaxID=1697973 RepID=UPI000E278EEA|nr:DUF3618 domain-containing protein [Sphingomonas crusticola]